MATATLDADLQRKIDEAVDSKISAVMKTVETRFTEMLANLDLKQKELNALREAAEKDRQELERLRLATKGAITVPDEPYEKRWYRDCPFEVRDCPGKGRGLFSKRELKKGEVLLVPIPYCSAVYENYKKTTCRYCFFDADGANAQPFKWICNGCKDVWYCSQQCRDADKAIHRAEECAIMKEWELDPETYSGEVITELKLMLRVLTTKAYEKLAYYEPRTDSIKYDDYCKLVAGKEDYDAETITELNFWLVDYICKLRKWLGKKEEPAELLDIILRNRRNGFFVAAIHGNNPVGTAVFVTPSFFNHSCTSNVWYQTDNARKKPRSFEYLALNDIAADTELCITYLDDDDVKKPVAQRRAQLFETFRFTCGCIRCSEEAAQKVIAVTSPTEVVELVEAVKSDAPKSETNVEVVASPAKVEKQEKQVEKQDQKEAVGAPAIEAKEEATLATPTKEAPAPAISVAP